jgi:hypothetical protein
LGVKLLAAQGGDLTGNGFSGTGRIGDGEAADEGADKHRSSLRSRIGPTNDNAAGGEPATHVVP